MIFDRRRFAAAFDVSRETLARLDALVAQVEKWQRAINLVARSTLPEIWHRHIADSAQFVAPAPLTARSWADLGAGAGFPGLVVAAMAADTRPNLHVTLIESDTRKAAFLTEAARAMGVDVTVDARRIEAVTPQAGFDVVSARALAPLPALLTLARPLLREGGTMLFAKGDKADSELEALDPIDRAAATRIISRTNPRASLLRWA
jgi:16S rRNA (guanine527-N7)-methyltransferase